MLLRYYYLAVEESLVIAFLRHKLFSFLVLQKYFGIVLFCLFFCLQEVQAACGGTAINWAGTSGTWTNGANWVGGNPPNTSTEDAIILANGVNPDISGAITVGCVDIKSGTLDGSTNKTLTVTGDYFKAPFQNSLNITNTSSTINMAGSAAQTFEAVDDLRKLTISNTTSVTLNNNFRILNTLTLTGTGTTNVAGIVQLSAALTIPSGHTVIIKTGGAIYASANVTVNGTLIVEGGGVLRMANATVLSVPSGGSLQLTGSAGNSSDIRSSNSSSWFTFSVAGSLSSNYGIITRTNAAGVNVTGTITDLNNTDFRGIVNNGYALTLGAAATIPSSMNSIGFYNDDGVATPKNINASAYNLSVTTLNSTAGSVAGAGFELDPNSKISWGTAAATELTVVEYARANEPTATLNPSTTVTFANFAFSLNKSDVATDITQIILTLSGTASMSDLSSVQAYRDVNGNCSYDAGTDTQIGSNLVFSGYPGSATITIPSGQVTTNSSTQKACVIIRATSSASPIDQHTLGFSILSSTDITNSQNYSLAAASGTPTSSGVTILQNTSYSVWTGAISTAWNLTTNWTPATIPTSTRDCQVGLASRVALVNTTPIRCANATLQTGGTLDFNNTTNVFEVYNALTVSSGFNFNNAINSFISMRGTTNQQLTLGTTYPGNLIINNTGASGSNTVTFGSSATINGNLTCTAGIFSIPSGVTLTVLGNVTIQTGCTIAVAGGGTLALANNKTLTVNAGGVLQMIGTAGAKAQMTSNSGASAYNVIVNGTIKAQYYSFDHLNTAGVSIEAGATIDPTYYLQDGTYSYPVNSSTTLLKLKRQIPGNALSNMNFTSLSSSATSITNIDTTGASAGTLAITNFSGDLSGSSFETAPVYLISWSGQLNTIAITQEATSPTTVLTGVTYNMGRFGFKQVSAGASYQDTDVTTLKLTLNGTGTASDIDAVRLYSDASCSGSGGTLIGTGTLGGTPASVTFSITAGALVVPAALITTTKVCAYVEFDISSSAINGNTVGLELTSSTDFVNSKTYAISAATSLPLTLGAASSISAPTTTTWTGGANSTAWNTAGNWSAGVPTASVNCTIPDAAKDPRITTGTASCKNIDVTNGILTIDAGTFLDVYGDYSNTGTITNSGTLSLKDGGTNIDHNIFSNSAITNLTLAKTGTGTVFLTQASLTINSLIFSSSTTTLEIPSGDKLVLPSGVTLGQGTLKIAGGGTLEVGNATTITVSGGTFKIAGTSDGFPQNISTKGIVQVTGGGVNTYNFTATSGTVDLVGFQFDRLGLNGLNIGGTTTVTNLSGGQFTNLSTTYASVKAIQINTSGTIPAVASNIAWSWGAFNSFNPANAGTPTSASAYKLISSTGCGNHTIDFTGWTGDWYESQPTFDVSTKVSTVATCTINLGASSSAVSILFFDAVPFNNAIDLRWRTNAERMHQGFNVYRADMYSAEFQQINKTLIRNLKNPGSNQVSYRFIDNDVVNNQRYYYYIEDVETSGRRVLHGPVSAMAEASLGTPPADNADENSGNNPKDPTDDGGTLPTPAPIPNPSYEDLGNGIKILSKTSKSLRIEIIPAAPQFSISEWNNLYQDVNIAGYSKMTAVGKPELPEKEVLIEVQSYATTAKINKASIIENNFAGHLISPAPDYSLNNSGVLIPNFIPHIATYEQASDYPTEYFSVQTNLLAVNKTKFLKIKINPLKLNPVLKNISMSSKIILDIGLDGDDWDVTPPDVNSHVGPYSVNNALQIDFTKSGVYQVSYEDLITSEVDGPFINTPVDQWRLYYRETEIPLDIYSANGNFSPGDYIRFYAPFEKELESHTNQLILSPVELTGDNQNPARMESSDVNPSGETESNEVLMEFTKTIEKNLKYIDGVSLNDGLDHFFFADLFNYPGMETLRVTTTLPEIDIHNPKNVQIKYHVRGRFSMSGLPVKHHVIFSLNGQEEGEAVFEENTRQVLIFEVPADRFTPGNNSLEFKVAGSFASGSENDIVLVDKIEIQYRCFNGSASGINHFSVKDAHRVHWLSGLTTNQIHGYDITFPLEPKKLLNMDVSSADGGLSFDARFFVDDVSDNEGLKYFTLVSSNSFLKPSALSLNTGVEESL